MSAPVEAELRKQLRLAVVMNGGVSLAVWMSGATHELNNCRLGDVADENSGASRQAWAAILARAGIDVVVDVVAGASAGGLNGTVLAKAVATGRDLPAALRTLWFEQAALSTKHLLFDPPNPKASLLNGRYFQDRVTDLLRLEGDPVKDDDQTMTLLVTATALPIAQQGAGPRQLAEVVQDSRRIYRFVARPGAPAKHLGVEGSPEVTAVDEFADVTTLALAARASASFPAAFQPVPEDENLRQRRAISPEAAGTWLMDGGILDNAPFEPLLNELRKRATDRAFRRVILYVNPSPEAARTGSYSASQPPGILATVRAFVSAAREPDRRLDAEELDRARNAARQAMTDPDQVLAALFGPQPAVPPQKLHDAGNALLPQYQLSRRRSLLVTSGAPAEKEQRLLDEPTAAMTAAYAVLVPASCTLPADSGWSWGLAAASRVLRWWGRALAKQSGSAAQRAAFAALGPTQRILQSLGEDFDQAVGVKRDDVDGWHQAAQRFLEERNAPTVVAKLIHATAVPVAQALGAPDAQQLIDASLDLEVINRATGWRSEEISDVPKFGYWRITPATEQDFVPSDLLEKPQWPTLKLYGARWGRFGAFAGERGRRWDWMWGRLDAAELLATQILAEGEVPNQEAQDLKATLIEAILTEEGRTVADVVRWAPRMLELSQIELWRDFAVNVDANSRNALRGLAKVLLGTLVPASWPKQVHALVDTGDLYGEHVPPGKRAGLVLGIYRVVGIVAQLIANGKVRQLLRGRVGKENYGPAYPDPPAD